MIAFCRNYLQQFLNGMGIAQVYTRPEDASRYKGLTFALVSCGSARLTRDGTRVAKEVTADGIIYRYRKYSVTVPIYVSLVGKNLDDAETYFLSFLRTLPGSIKDTDGNAVDVHADQSDVLQEESQTNPREGHEITVIFEGGIYEDVTVPTATQIADKLQFE